jgi:hypothetical protein
MSDDDRRQKFTVIKGRKSRLDLDQGIFEAKENAVQTSLFPRAKAGVVLFVSFPAIGEREFIDVIERANPSYVFDLRLAPRFDVGQMTRQKAFDLFQSKQVHYVDMPFQVGVASDREQVWKKVRETLGRASFSLTRPVVFLLGHAASSLATDTEILTVLAEIGKSATEVVQVPNYA